MFQVATVATAISKFDATTGYPVAVSYMQNMHKWTLVRDYIE